MKLFNRRQKVNTDLPPEVQAYSQAERRERMGVAWLVGLVSLVVTLILIAALFFGGRWVYRKLARKDNKPVPVQLDSNDDTKTEDAKDKDTQDQNTTSNDTTNNSQGDTEQTPSTSPSSNATPQTPTTQPATGDTLPNTGPDIDL